MNIQTNIIPQGTSPIGLGYGSFQSPGRERLGTEFCSMVNFSSSIMKGEMSVVVAPVFAAIGNTDPDGAIADVECIWVVGSFPHSCA